jgi:alkanesulfonate monooxygenase SsuD/methylene tetrahydromethanopterin reductase-like flavin-dependent oxidoreductase (luciferase family)
MPSQRAPKWGVIYNADALPLSDVLHFAALAEQAGADSLWTAEGWRDGLVPLSAIASRVNRIRLGTGILQMARPPVLTVLSALSMAEYTNGRFVLGVGTGPRDWNRNWHGMDVPHPVPQMREYIECLRTLLKAAPDRPAKFEGKYYNVQGYTPFLEPPAWNIPIYLAGVNRRMIELAGSHADGLILGPLNSVPYLKDTVHPNLKKGLDKRSTGGCELCVTRICAVHEDPQRARDLARHAIAFYSVLPYYDVVLSPLGFSGPVAAIRDAFSRMDFPAMIDAVTDDMVSALAFAGTADEVRQQAKQFEGLVDCVILYTPFFGIVVVQEPVAIGARPVYGWLNQSASVCYND